MSTGVELELVIRFVAGKSGLSRNTWPPVLEAVEVFRRSCRGNFHSSRCSLSLVTFGAISVAFVTHSTTFP